jgi:hypothetical protein
MRTQHLFLCVMLAFGFSGFGQTLRPDQKGQIAAKLPLDVSIERFDVTDEIMRDGLSELSLKNISGLHLGFEEIIREKIQDDPRATNPHFSIHLRRKSVREILDELCKADARYTWSADGTTINVYPRAPANERSYLLNLWIDKIRVDDIPDPDQALTPLSKMFPLQQLGYDGPGLGDNTYVKPWTAVFDGLTVRQFINRLAEHMGSQTSWVWRGGRNERMFTFLKGGFHMSSPSDAQ